MTTLSQFFYGSSGGVIKSIQNGLFSFQNFPGTGTVTISSVNPQKAFVIINGQAGMTALSSTQISLETLSTGTVGSSFGSWQVVEYY